VFVIPSGQGLHSRRQGSADARAKLRKGNTGRARPPTLLPYRRGFSQSVVFDTRDTAIVGFMAPAFDEIKLLTGPFEGNISHMYVDTIGYVTVGIGNMLPDVTAAQRLAFVNRTTKNAATAAEISVDFATVSKQPKGKAARWYRPFTNLDLPDVEVNRLFQKRVQEFQVQLGKVYPRYDSYPDPAQLAMLDMAFNLGTSALKNKWPKLNEAIEKQDWKTAADQSNRPDASAVRNAATKALFLKASGGSP
jgi:GH24 family phage-related lysozyme (muramidase)